MGDNDEFKTRSLHGIPEEKRCAAGGARDNDLFDPEFLCPLDGKMGCIVRVLRAG
jgi:hypothetical protein